MHIVFVYLLLGVLLVELLITIFLPLVSTGKCVCSSIGYFKFKLLMKNGCCYVELWRSIGFSLASLLILFLKS